MSYNESGVKLKEQNDFLLKSKYSLKQLEISNYGSRSKIVGREGLIQQDLDNLSF